MDVYERLERCTTRGERDITALLSRFYYDTQDARGSRIVKSEPLRARACTHGGVIAPRATRSIARRNNTARGGKCARKNGTPRLSETERG